MWRNSQDSYGLVTITLHWLVTIAVVGLFALGLWMVELDYYDSWYNRGPELHKNIGILLFMVMLARLGWRYGNPHPRLIGSRFEQKAAGIVHRLLYALMYLLMISGYLISTADGRAIEIFGLIDVPATLTSIENQEDIAGLIHEWVAYALIGLAALHGAAALKHHFIDRDEILKRMLIVKH